MQIPKKCANDFSQEVEEFRSRVKCRYMVIGRLIFIKVLWNPSILILQSRVNSRLCLSSSKLYISSSFLSLIIFTYQYVLWIKVSQSITYPELQGKLPSSQSLQNHSRCAHRQIWSSCPTRQDLQLSSHNSSVTMTCWCQSSIIYPITWGGAPLSSSQQP